MGQTLGHIKNNVYLCRRNKKSTNYETTDLCNDNDADDIGDVVQQE
jgi:hypothetical protein